MQYHLSFDDYCEENYKLAKLLLKYDLQATFFIQLEHNGDRRSPMTQLKAISEMGFEIGCHSLDHSILKFVNDYELELQTYYIKDLIENITGKPCKWYCPPKGKYDDRVVNKILEAGFKFIRTVDVLDDTPIQAGLNKTTVHVLDGRKEYKGKNWVDVACSYLDNDYSDDERCFKLWGHGWEIDRGGEWKNLEKVLERLSHAQRR